MIRVRIALSVQAALALICVLGFRYYTDAFRHPIGSAESAYGWAARASLFVTGWLFVETIIVTWPCVEAKQLAWVRGWKCAGFMILSLLLLLVTKIAVDGMLIRE